MRWRLVLAFVALAPSAQAASDVARFGVSAIVPGACTVTLTPHGAACAAPPRSPSPPAPTVTLTHDASGRVVMTLAF